MAVVLECEDQEGEVVEDGLTWVDILSIRHGLMVELRCNRRNSIRFALSWGWDRFLMWYPVSKRYLTC